MERYFAFLIIANIWIAASWCAPHPAKGIMSLIGIVWLAMAIIILIASK